MTLKLGTEYKGLHELQRPLKKRPYPKLHAENHQKHCPSWPTYQEYDWISGEIYSEKVTLHCNTNNNSSSNQDNSNEITHKIVSPISISNSTSIITVIPIKTNALYQFSVQEARSWGGGNSRYLCQQACKFFAKNQETENLPRSAHYLREIRNRSLSYMQHKDWKVFLCSQTRNHV